MGDDRVALRIDAMIAARGAQRISHRDVVELCEQLFSSRISTGTIEGTLTRAADALSWSLARRQRVLWRAMTDRHAVLRREPDRHNDRV
jgi:hypothetical protein